MSDTITDAELDKVIKAVREEGEFSQRTHGIGRAFGEYVAGVIIMLRQQVATLTEENAKLKSEAMTCRCPEIRDCTCEIDRHDFDCPQHGRPR